jgi:hypothetical protein
MIIPPINASKAAGFLIRLTFDQLWTLQTAPRFLRPLLNLYFISVQQQELLHNLQRVKSAHHPNLDVGHSMFSENDDFIFDAFREGLVTDLKNRRFLRFSGLQESAGSLEYLEIFRVL